jgi:hypothetical protein
VALEAPASRVPATGRRLRGGVFCPREITYRSYFSPKAQVFVFFSNRLGCLGSLLVSVIGTLILLALLHLI